MAERNRFHMAYPPTCLTPGCAGVFPDFLQDGLLGMPQVSPPLRDLGLRSSCSHVYPSQTFLQPSLYSASVPAHPKRYYGSGDLHFVTTSCYHRRPILASPGCRDLFLYCLEQMRRRYRFVILGYVVMPEHVHLLLSEPQRHTISTVVQAIKLAFARRLLTYGKAIHPPSPSSAPQHVWQARFYDFNVWTEKKRVEKLRYMHRNPVNRGLVESPEQWRWSSFRFYLYGELEPVKVNDTDIRVMKIRSDAA